MDYLRDGIGLRWTLGREPIVEYEREGFDMYGAMTDAIKEESVGYVFNLDAAAPGAGTGRGPTDGLHFTAPTLDTAEGVVEGEFAPADATPAVSPPDRPGPEPRDAPVPPRARTRTRKQRRRRR
jgi:preprotein translocase subunit SecA